MPYPICSVIAVVKMLVRILTTLPSRIWDRAFFLFSDYSNSREWGFSRRLWISMGLNSKELTFRLLYVAKLH